MLRHYRPGTDRDIIFVPVGINYDRTLEDRSQLRTLHADAARRSKWFVIKTTLRFIGHTAILMIMSRWQRFGYACVNFGTPISMKEYCRQNQFNFSHLERRARFREIQILADQLMTDIKQLVPILPIPLVSTVMKENGSQGISAFDVESQTTRLLGMLQSQNAPLYVLDKNRVETVLNALNMLKLRRLVWENGRRYHPVADQDEVLTYYANSIAHWLTDEQKSK